MKHKINVGDCFQPGEIWQSPKALLWEVIAYESKPGKKKQAVLMCAEPGQHRPNQRRDWDAVEGWFIHQHAPSNDQLSTGQSPVAPT